MTATTTAQPADSTAANDRRFTYVWVILCAITILSWWLGSSHGGGHLDPSVPITVSVLAIAAIKARLIIRYFMEVRTAPRWLRVSTDAWLALFFGAVLAIYFW